MMVSQPGQPTSLSSLKGEEKDVSTIVHHYSGTQYYSTETVFSRPTCTRHDDTIIVVVAITTIIKWRKLMR